MLFSIIARTLSLTHEKPNILVNYLCFRFYFILFSIFYFLYIYLKIAIQIKLSNWVSQILLSVSLGEFNLPKKINK